MNYNFIEIGTSDFRTLIQTHNGIGLSIEPIKYYLDKLPNKDNVTKINCGISKEDGEVNIYYVKPEDIIKHKLPNWVRGCNSINNPHPTVKRLLGDSHDNVITIDRVKILSWGTLISEYNISGIQLLKIDTEGHDGIILEGYLKECLKNNLLFANEIIFENNVLADKPLNERLITKFTNLGYVGEDLGDDYKLIKNT